MQTHEKYIRRCLELAKNGLGTTYPNPMVGSVIVYKDSIIGEGWHQKAGEAHAEVNAVNSVKDKELLKKSTIYVSLEPCSHFGKTPPCADLIIGHKIPKVVIGCLDPHDKVAGRGVKKLLEAGCKVIVGVMEEECRELNKRFFTFHQQKRPYIILKWAQTLDGFIAATNQQTGKPVWITNRYSKQLVHQWRSEEHAILVGTTTAIKDNPQLNVRLWEGKNPVRIVIDKDLKIPETSYLFDQDTKTIVLTSEENKNRNTSSENLLFETVDFEKNIPEQICEALYKKQIQSLIIEGGTKTLQTFIDADIWDEARVFSGDVKFEKGIEAPVLKKKTSSEEQIESDILNIYFND